MKIAISLMLATFFLFGCSKQPPKELLAEQPSKELLGSWKITEFRGRKPLLIFNPGEQPQGNWSFVGSIVEIDEKEIDWQLTVREETLAGLNWGGKLEWGEKEEREASGRLFVRLRGSYAVDTSATPTHLQLKVVDADSEDDSATKTLPAIFSLEGDKLRIVRSHDSSKVPSSFEVSDSDLDFTLIELQRLQPSE